MSRPIFRMIKSRNYSIKAISSNISDYRLPWNRSDERHKLVVHLDVSPDNEGQTGGGIAWVCKNFDGKIIRQHSKWIGGLSDINELQFHALMDYTAHPLPWKTQTLCCPSDTVVQYVDYILKDKKGSKGWLNDLAKKSVIQMENNFPIGADITLKFVPEANRLANNLANLERFKYVESHLDPAKFRLC